MRFFAGKHIMMRQTLFILCMLAGSLHAAEPRPTGRNCNLTLPPAAAGEETLHGKTLRVFPRSKDIDASYTGCQVLFMPWRAQWQVVVLTEIVKGDPIRVWSDEHGDSSAHHGAHHGDSSAHLACRYRDGKVVKGNPQTCPPVEELLTKSLAPGCLDLIRVAAAKDAVRPEQCKYE
jgi:hypothetical protein